MSQENVEIVRTSRRAFLENDFEAWFAITDPGCKLYPRPEEPGVKQCYEGWDEILGYLVNWYSGWKEVHRGAGAIHRRRGLGRG